MATPWEHLWKTPWEVQVQVQVEMQVQVEVKYTSICTSAGAGVTRAASLSSSVHCSLATAGWVRYLAMVLQVVGWK